MLAMSLFIAALFLSCSNDDLSNYSNYEQASSRKAARTAPKVHSISIVNNSNYNYEYMILAARNSYDVNESIEMYHKGITPFRVRPHESVTYHDYKLVSDVHFEIQSWRVVDFSLRQSDIGTFSSDIMPTLFGALSQPNNPYSDRYPIWKYISGAVLNDSGVYMAVLSGNSNSPTSSLYELGNLDQNYNSILNYGNSGSLPGGGLANDALVAVKWKTTPNGAVKVTVDNVD